MSIKWHMEDGNNNFPSGNTFYRMRSLLRRHPSYIHSNIQSSLRRTS